MGMFFFYNNRKPRKFNYTPILYNPEEEARKEKLNKRIAEIKREMGVASPEAEVPKPKEFKSEFIGQTKHLKKRKDREETGQKSFFTNNGILYLIILVLLAVLYFWILR